MSPGPTFKPLYKGQANTEPQSQGSYIQARTPYSSSRRSTDSECQSDYVKNLEMRPSWIIHTGSKCHHQCPYKRAGRGRFETEEKAV